MARPVEADWWLSLPPTFGSLPSLQFVPGRDRVGWRGGGLWQMGGGGIRAYTCGVLAVLLTAMHHDANIVLEHKEALDATGRRTRRLQLDKGRTTGLVWLRM